MDNNSSTNRITPKVTPVTPKVTPVVPKVTPVTPKVTPVVPKVTPVTPEVAPVTPKVAPVTPQVAPVRNKVSSSPKIKKFLLWGGIIAASLVLIVAGIIFLEWYNTTYIPEEETQKLEEVISQLRSLPSHEEKIARLSSAIAQYPKAKKSNALSLIRDLKDKIRQETAERELKQRQEAEKRKRELICRQIAEREERLRQERESREQAILEDYRHSLNNNRSENIFILRENPALPEYQFILFQYNEALITKLQQLQKLKEQKHAFDNAMASLVKQYNSNNRNFNNAQEFIQMKNASANADQLLPALAAEIAASAKTLTVDANDGTHKVNCAFRDIPDGKWLIAGFSADGGMILQTITKNAGFPLFLNLQSDGFRDVSVKHYNQSEQEKLKRAIAAAALQKKSERAPAAPNQEQNIRGLIFFAKLRDNLNATGGIPVRSKRKSVAFATVNDIRTIKFSGTLAQGIRYRWKAITGDAPRTVSLWFCCTGYNKHDGGNAIFSYGIKDFGKYFDIETNRSQNLSCAWGEPSGLLVPKIENNRWNHLVITYDGTTRICYLNGKVASSIRTKLQTANSDLKIGTRLNDIAHCFVGGIRNVAVYNRALNKDEVIFLNNGGIE